MRTSPALSRREFLAATAGLCVTGLTGHAESSEPEPVIDIHQHTHYSGRANHQLIAHQRAMGVTQTVLLPAGSKYGLDADCGGNRSVAELARWHPGTYLFFANEITDLPEATEVIADYLRRGAIGIGEQKFKVACDSASLEAMAELALEFGVPVLLHFQHQVYNTGIENFHKVLEKYPKVTFIGHAQTWWGNVDQNHQQETLYPIGKVTPGGITDRLLTDYPNMFGDTSAGSGLNFLTRDEEHARGFLERHQDQLLFGSDCNDTLGRGQGCQGARILSALRHLSPSKAVERKILYHNAKRLMKIPDLA